MGGSWQRFPCSRRSGGNVLGRERLCGAAAWQGLCAWCEAQAEGGAGSRAGGVGGVSSREGCSGTGQVRGFNGKLCECCGHRGERQCSGGRGAVRAVPRCLGCVCRAWSAGVAETRWQWRGQGEMAANELSPSCLGASKLRIPLCSIPNVPITQEGGMESRFPSCGHRRCVTGMGAASRDNHGSCFRTSPVAARAPRVPFVLSGRDPPWGESLLPKMHLSP